ncbi:MAG: hypothetical protein Q9219_004428 [cf. Caloplaca sp. 3 TL-2023]
MSPGPMVNYPQCLVRKDSVSAFIQCADLQGPDAPEFTLTEDGDANTVRTLELLTTTLADTPSCGNCPLAANIRKASDEHGLGSFAKSLCQLHPVDAGICCLRECLGGLPQEHSIEAFCSGSVNDLMNAPLVPLNCISNKINGNAANGEGSSDSGTAKDDSSPIVSSNGEPTPTSVDKDSAADSPPSTTSSTVLETSPTVDTTVAIGTTSASSVSQETPSTGAGSRTRADSVHHMMRLGLAMLPMAAVF